MLKVAEIWRYPVKSMAGEKLDTAEVTTRGLPYDRGWAVREDRTQAIRSARYIPELLMCTARTLPDTNAGLVPHVVIKLPDGSTVNSDDSRANARLSEAVGRAVTLLPLRPPEDIEHLRHGPSVTGDPEKELRMLMGLEADDPLPDFSAIPPEIMKDLRELVTPRGTYFDAFTLHVVAAATLRHLAQLLPDAQIAVPRFRPNLVIDDDAGSVQRLESQWVGKRLKIGACEIAGIMECPRCAIPSSAHPGLARDRRITHTLAHEFRHALGLYCDIKSAGTVRVGDAVTLN